MKFPSFLAASSLTLSVMLLGGCGGGSGGPSRPSNTPRPTPTSGPNLFAGQIAFTSQRGGTDLDIYLMDVEGTNQRPFSAINSTGQERWPDLARDGSFVVWSSDRNTGNAPANNEIYFANSNGTNIKQYTKDTGSNPPNDYQPSISPNGTKIAWTTSRGGNLNIAVMDSTGANQKLLTNNNTGEDSYPAWTNDSSSIVFYSARGTTRGIYIMNADGTNQRPLLTSATSVPTFYLAPAFSRDGSLLVVASQSSSGSTISLRNANGTPASTTFAPTMPLAYRNNPSFSPDGTRLIYTGYNTSGGEQLYTANLDGSDERMLTSVGANFNGTFG